MMASGGSGGASADRPKREEARGIKAGKPALWQWPSLIDARRAFRREDHSGTCTGLLLQSRKKYPDSFSYTSNPAMPTMPDRRPLIRALVSTRPANVVTSAARPPTQASLLPPWHEGDGNHRVLPGAAPPAPKTPADQSHDLPSRRRITSRRLLLQKWRRRALATA